MGAVNPFASGAQHDVLGKGDLILRRAASFLRCRGIFRGPTAFPHFIPTEEAVLARRRSFSMYISRIEKACHVRGFEYSWGAEAARVAARVMERAGQQSFGLQ